MLRNKVILIGRLTRDIELKKTPSDVSVANFTIAIDEPYNKEHDHPEATFIDCVAWKGQAEFLEKYFSKGSKVGIGGHLQVRNWEDKDKNKRKTVEVYVEEIEFVERKNSNGQNSDTYKENDSVPIDNSESEDDLPF